MKSPTHLGHAALLLLLCLGIAGCARIGAVSSDAEPAQIEPIAGTDLQRVIVTQEGSQSLGIQTALVGRDASATGTRPGVSPESVIPMQAVIYDPKGSSWVYTTPAPRTFVRTPVVIDHTTSETAYLSSGPPPGTEVVTVGASELLGAEYGVGGE